MTNREFIVRVQKEYTKITRELEKYRKIWEANSKDLSAFGEYSYHLGRSHACEKFLSILKKPTAKKSPSK